MSDVLGDLARHHGWGEYEALLRQYALPCVGFHLDRSSSGCLGGSRLGGGPDLPDGFEWPSNKGRPLDFLLQINLADVAPVDSAGLYPSTGLLYFFYDLEEEPWGYDPHDLDGHAVRFVSEPGNLKQAAPPHPDYELPATVLRFWPAETLPSFGSRAYDQLMAKLPAKARSDAQLDAYSDLAVALFDARKLATPGAHHRLGGHSDNIQGDMQLEAQLVTNGLYCGDESGYKEPGALSLERTCEEWSLLLQLDSDDAEDEGFMWGDSGMLYFWIRAHDLASRNFRETWLGLQCF